MPEKLDDEGNPIEEEEPPEEVCAAAERRASVCVRRCMVQMR